LCQRESKRCWCGVAEALIETRVAKSCVGKFRRALKIWAPTRQMQQMTLSLASVFHTPQYALRCLIHASRATCNPRIHPFDLTTSTSDPPRLVRYDCYHTLPISLNLSFSLWAHNLLSFEHFSQFALFGSQIQILFTPLPAFRTVIIIISISCSMSCVRLCLFHAVTEIHVPISRPMQCFDRDQQHRATAITSVSPSFFPHFVGYSGNNTPQDAAEWGIFYTLSLI
jgi:hypothetical protein